MPLNKDYEDLFQLLNSDKAKYLVVGAYAVIYYTEPRYTKDIDIWIKPDPENAEKVYKALKKFGAPIGNLTVHDLMNPEMVYQVGIEPNRIDILMGVGKLSFDQAWKNRKTARYGGKKIFILDLHDLVKTKQMAGRPKDKIDLEQLKLKLKKKRKK